MLYRQRPGTRTTRHHQWPCCSEWSVIINYWC